MRKIILLTSLLLSLLCSSCEYNPLRFVWTDQDVSERVAQSLAYNDTTEVRQEVIPGKDYSVVFVSDTHIKDDTTNMHHFFDAIRPLPASFMIYNGDLYHGLEEYANVAQEVMKKSPKKPYYVCGNHDLFFGWDVYFNRFGSSTYTIEVQQEDAKDLFIILETGSATLGKTQYEWLLNVFKNRLNYRHCFVVTHTNFIAQSVTNGVYLQEEMHMLFDLFHQNKVDAVLTGHSHIANDETILGVRYITTGAGEYQEYGVLKINDKAVDFDFLHWEN